MLSRMLLLRLQFIRKSDFINNILGIKFYVLVVLVPKSKFHKLNSTQCSTNIKKKYLEGVQKLFKFMLLRNSGLGDSMLNALQ